MFFPRLLKVILLLSFLHVQLAYSQGDPPSHSDSINVSAIKNFGIAPPAADAETPGSLACVYGLTPSVPGCSIKLAKRVPTGGSGVIAVTESGHDPYALTELNYFSQQFGLPQLPRCGEGVSGPCFQTYYASTCSPTGTPPVTITTGVEHEIDIEWAHAMAPNATIYMVEADPFSTMDGAIPALTCASRLVAEAGGGIVSNSWSFPEFPGEAAYDAYFQTPGIIYVASSGDYSAPARYPSSSPYVISAGGSNILRDSLGNFVSQTSWSNPIYPIGTKFSGGSGGPSLYESRPAYQNSVQKVVGNARGTPDISFFADQRTAIFYCPTSNCPAEGQWVKNGGTSLAAPALAGIINSAHSGATSAEQELSLIYTGALKNYRSYWTDITTGNNGYPSLPGYDFTTGLGTPLGYSGK
ncbi:MAG: S8 family serine peptidase [Gammaproteobacteria bacterium]|nr:S8 family serine peptidase [Gammaproteobacteria bacterium]